MPSPGDNLSINALAAATGVTPKSLGTIAGSTATPILVSQFTITGVTTPTANAASVIYGSTITVTANFTGAGSRFLSRIGSRTANFTWSAPANLTLTTNNGYNRIYTNAYNPGSTSCSSSTTRTVTVTLADGFNLTASNYNTALTTAAFTVYSPPKPTITYSSGTKPSTCVVGGDCTGANVYCYGATLTFSGNAGTYQTVAGSSLDYYVGRPGSVAYSGTRAGNTSSYTTPATLCTNTTYNFYVINNYTCQSDTGAAATPTYV